MTRSVSGRNTLLSRGLIRAVVIEKAAGGGGYGTKRAFSKRSRHTDSIGGAAERDAVAHFGGRGWKTDPEKMAEWLREGSLEFD